MARTLAVFGATGNQGHSVIKAILADPDLSSTYTTIKALTRDTTTPKAKALSTLSSAIYLTQADPTSPSSLRNAFTGADTAFLMTTPVFAPDGTGEETEYQAGKLLVDAAIAAGVSHIIFSTLPSPAALSSGRYKDVRHFESKVRIQDYIDSRRKQGAIKASFVSVGCFMQDFTSLPIFRPVPLGDGSGAWQLALGAKSTTKLPLIDHADIGLFVAALLRDPEGLEGKVLAVAVEWVSFEGIAAALSEASGKEVRYKHLSREEYVASLSFGKEEFPQMMACLDESEGYWGAGSEERVEQSLALLRWKPRAFREFLAAEPPKLD